MDDKAGQSCSCLPCCLFRARHGLGIREVCLSGWNLPIVNLLFQMSHPILHDDCVHRPLHHVAPGSAEWIPESGGLALLQECRLSRNTRDMCMMQYQSSLQVMHFQNRLVQSVRMYAGLPPHRKLQDSSLP